MSSNDQAMVYGHRRDIVHVPDHEHPAVGRIVAGMISSIIRVAAATAGDDPYANAKELCPGCYMLVGFNALLQLANDNGQSRRELALTMANAFQVLAEAAPDDEGWRDTIQIILDPAVCTTENCV